MSKKKIQPWEYSPHIWKTEAQFWAWLRGCLRKAWMRYPPSIDWKKAQGHPPPPGYTGKAKKFGTCALCGEEGVLSALEVDHIDEGGSIKSYQDAMRWLEKILDVNDNWQLAHKDCHKIKTYAFAHGLTFEEARIEKQFIIPFKKLKAEQQIKELTKLSKSVTIPTKAADRIELYRQLIKENNNETRAV